MEESENPDIEEFYALDKLIGEGAFG